MGTTSSLGPPPLPWAFRGTAAGGSGCGSMGHTSIIYLTFYRVLLRGIYLHTQLHDFLHACTTGLKCGAFPGAQETSLRPCSQTPPPRALRDWCPDSSVHHDGDRCRVCLWFVAFTHCDALRVTWVVEFASRSTCPSHEGPAVHPTSAPHLTSWWLFACIPFWGQLRITPV